ncbi:MAG: hypothetical protein WC851_04065 [Candidatus Shapirobacteria bacterium]|jgi:hypothetical protein
MSEIDVALIKLLATNLNNAQYVDPASRTFSLNQLISYSRTCPDLKPSEFEEVEAAIKKLQSTLPTSR